MYNVVFDESAIDFLNKLPRLQKERIFAKIILAKDDPFRFFERLNGRAEFKLRVGGHRVIADILENEIVIQVLYIGHRKNIYMGI